jgi:integral membrane sensor domain MASE1
MSLFRTLPAVRPTVLLAALLLAVSGAQEPATYAVQQNASGSAVHVLCGLLLVLHHQLATCSNRQQQNKNSNKAPKVSTGARLMTTLT